MNTLGNYHDLYLKTDVLLLTDMFEKFISACLDYYGLDLCHYFSSPGLSWDVMLRKTKLKLDLISDIDMHLFIEKGMRGGISYIAKRHSKANNKYMKCYDSNKKSIYIYITYLDANNLYGQAISQCLPYNGFKRLSQKEISEFCLNSVSENSSIGYVLEVGLEYPIELHNLHNDYPLASEKLEISQNMLLKYCSNIVNKHGTKICKVIKLVPNLDNNVVHYRNLQLYLSLGMKVTKVHRILKFKRSDWLKKYMIVIQTKEKNAANSFEKNFLKLMKVFWVKQ